MNLAKRMPFVNILPSPNSRFTKVAYVSYCKFAKVLPRQNFVLYSSIYVYMCVASHYNIVALHVHVLYDVGLDNISTASQY